MNQEKQLVELMEIMEDTVEYFCDQHIISGETVWNMVASLAQAKLNVEFPTNAVSYTHLTLPTILLV